MKDVDDAIPMRGPLRAVISAMRPRQWVKNGLVFLAPMAAGVVLHWHVLVHCLIAFVAFCLAASGVYMLNDARDIEADRHHPKKRRRAIAAGQVKPKLAVFLGFTFAIIGLAVTQVDGWNGPLLLIIGIYIANSFAYVYGVKKIAVIEMASVASGFFLRAISGATANHLYVSKWFLVVISFGAMFLVVGKRSAEVHRLGAGAGEHRAVLTEYGENFLNSALTLTATAVVLGYCLWAFDTSTAGLSSIHHHVVAIEISVVPVVLAILHILRLLEGGGGGAPEDLVLEDRVIQILGLTWVILLGIGIYR